MEPSAAPLEGQVAIVTGASRGIGRAVAERFAAVGAQVALVARTGADLQRVADGIEAKGGVALPIRADIGEERQVEAAVRAVLEQFGQVDILVNNAGIGVWGPVKDFSLADWERTLRTNLTGAFLCSRAVLPAMMLRRRGQILTIASGAGRNGIPNLAAYSASKFGLIGFCESLAAEVRQWNIKVSVLSPGSVSTGFGRDFPADRPGRSARPLQPADVAEALLALATQPPEAWISDATVRPLRLA